jgi:branched-chain amino acid transport system ATP-binding protein
MSFIEITKLFAGYSGVAALRDVELLLERGEIVTLLGANGAGKSTLVKSLSGQLKPLSGAIFFEGVEITKLSPAERIRLGIVHVPEGRQIFAGMTTAENLLLGAYAIENDSIRKRQYEQVCELFPFLKVCLLDTAGNLSGGQQQLLAIARGLMSNPKVLLLDEPSLGVAPLLVAEIFKLITRLREAGITILLAEQNARQALSIADRGYVFENGIIGLHGEANELLESSEVAEKYLGAGSARATAKIAGLKIADDLRACMY